MWNNILRWTSSHLYVTSEWRQKRSLVPWAGKWQRSFWILHSPILHYWGKFSPRSGWRPEWPSSRGFQRWVTWCQRLVWLWGCRRYRITGLAMFVGTCDHSLNERTMKILSFSIWIIINRQSGWKIILRPILNSVNGLHNFMWALCQSLRSPNCVWLPHNNWPTCSRTLPAKGGTEARVTSPPFYLAARGYGYTQGIQPSI